VDLKTLDSAWVAVQVCINREHVVAEHLAARGYESFAPLYRPRKQNRLSNGFKPLFPGYLFCRYRTSFNYRIVEAPWVVRIVGTGKAPTPIPEEEVVAIRKVVNSPFQPEPWRTLRVGQRVQVQSGPLLGVTGTLVQVKNGTRLVIGVNALQQYVAVEVGILDAA
jgi:transcription antitermination factor NusG